MHHGSYSIFQRQSSESIISLGCGVTWPNHSPGFVPFPAENPSNLRTRTEFMKRDDLLLGSETVWGNGDKKGTKMLKKMVPYVNNPEMKAEQKFL